MTSRSEYYRVWSRKDYTRDPLVFRVKRMFHDAKQRAKSSGMSFDLDLEWLIGEAKTAHERFCFDLRAVGTSTRMSMTLDRFNNAEGYTKSNTRVIPYWMNRAKGGCSLEEMEQVLAYMRG